MQQKKWEAKRAIETFVWWILKNGMMSGSENLLCECGVLDTSSLLWFLLPPGPQSSRIHYSSTISSLAIFLRIFLLSSFYILPPWNIHWVHTKSLGFMLGIGVQHNQDRHCSYSHRVDNLWCSRRCLVWCLEKDSSLCFKLCFLQLFIREFSPFSSTCRI